MGAFAVKVAAQRLPVSPFFGFDLYHHFRSDAFYDLYKLLNVRKTEGTYGDPGGWGVSY